jgi:hypothetical protein
MIRQIQVQMNRFVAKTYQGECDLCHVSSSIPEPQALLDYHCSVVMQVRQPSWVYIPWVLKQCLGEPGALWWAYIPRRIFIN